MNFHWQDSEIQLEKCKILLKVACKLQGILFVEFSIIYHLIRRSLALESKDPCNEICSYTKWSSETNASALIHSSKFKIPNCPNPRFKVTPDFYSNSGIEKNFKNNLKWGLLGETQVLDSLPAANYWFSKSPHHSTCFSSASHIRLLGLLGYCLSLLWTPCISFFVGNPSSNNPC
jgi:hypothetical protein